MGAMLLFGLLRVTAELDLPALSDLSRFPPPAAVSAALDFNRAYRLHLEYRRAGELYRWQEITEIIQETDQLYRVWDSLDSAQEDLEACGWNREEALLYRCRALATLRQLLGPEWYYEGVLPPCVPVWRFDDIDDHR